MCSGDTRSWSFTMYYMAYVLNIHFEYIVNFHLKSSPEIYQFLGILFIYQMLIGFERYVFSVRAYFCQFFIITMLIIWEGTGDLYEWIFFFGFNRTLCTHNTQSDTWNNINKGTIIILNRMICSYTDWERNSNTFAYLPLLIILIRNRESKDEYYCYHQYGTTHIIYWIIHFNIICNNEICQNSQQ